MTIKEDANHLVKVARKFCNNDTDKSQYGALTIVYDGSTGDTDTLFYGDARFVMIVMMALGGLIKKSLYGVEDIELEIKKEGNPLREPKGSANQGEV